MDPLYLLQFTSMVITLLMAVMLVISRLQLRWLSRRYEVSRWLIAFGMAMLSLHYVLQMRLGFRATSDEIGAVVNILFYTPISLVISYGTYNVVCSHPKGRKRFILVGAIMYFLILAVFALGYQMKGSLHLGRYVYVMLAFFGIVIFYCFAINIIEMHRHRRIMEENSASDMLPYDRYTWASYLNMAMSILGLMVGIVYRPFLFVTGPLMLLALFIFTTSFIAYGYNIMPADDLLDEEDDVAESQIAEVRPVVVKPQLVVETEKNEALSDATEKIRVGNLVAENVEARNSATENVVTENSNADNLDAGFDSDKMALIEEALQKWCKQGGFRDSTTNMVSLSQKLQVSKSDLSQYFERYLGSTFRVWLSDIRFQKAQRMIRENPEFSNDYISLECGLSSHAHLYKIFKAKTGMTPRQWKNSIAE